MKTADSLDSRPSSRPGGSSVTSAALLLLVLTPAVALVAGAEAFTHGRVGTAPEARGGAGAQAVHPAATGGTGTVPAAGGEAGHAPAGGTRAGESGLLLLEEAVAASRTASYQGVQIVSWWNPGGTTTMVVTVAHQPRRGTVLRTAETSTQHGTEAFVAEEPGAQPGDVLGVTEETLGLLAANYQLRPAGAGAVCGRPAIVVEAWRGSGNLAARFWLDRVTKIPLRREIFDDRSRMVNENTFIDLDLDRPYPDLSARSRPAAVPGPWNVLTTADVTALRIRGWPLPRRLPGLTLFSARRAAMPSGPVLQLGYSDGLSVLSLFVQRGGLPHEMAGWHAVEVGGHPVYALDQTGQRFAWASHGHVLTLIADAPAVTIQEAVASLPHDTRPGFWGRLRHGFGRVISWINPFG